MTYGSLLIAAVVIAGWNILSLVVEYALLRHVYVMVPRLAVKEDPGEGRCNDFCSMGWQVDHCMG